MVDSMDKRTGRPLIHAKDPPRPPGRPQGGRQRDGHLHMRQAFGPLVERGSVWLERRGVGSLGPRLKRLAYEPGREPVRIDDLVSPLRYDVLVRERYFAFLREHRALAAEDFQAFAELSRSQPVYR